MKISTRIVNFEACPSDPFRPVATPIYQTATFEQESAVEVGRYDYSRSGNPTRTVLEQHVATLEHGSRAFCFASGMAALSSVTRLLQAGDEIVASDDLYGGSYRLLSRIVSRNGIVVRYAGGPRVENFQAQISKRTRLIHVESPTNPLLRILDLRSLAALAHQHGALLSVDNSIMSPYLQTPLDLGADIVIHSATKFLCGHSDVTAGAVVVRDEKLADELYFIQNGEGTALGPMDSFLLLRGLKTLAVRMDRQQSNAEQIAKFLVRHPDVQHVFYPGLHLDKSKPDLSGTQGLERGAELHRSQACGPGAVVSFTTGCLDRSRRIVESVRLFGITVSFGSVNSSISMPAFMSHASIPAEIRATRQLPEDLVRISIGIEDVDDLIADLGMAIDSSVGRGDGISKGFAAD